MNLQKSNDMMRNRNNDQTETEKLIQEILQEYPLLKAQATIDKEELFNLWPNCIANYIGEGGGSSGTSDQTGNYAIARTTKETPAMKKVRAIEVVYESLTGMQQKLTKLYYWERWNPYECWTSMGVRKSYFYALRRKVINRFAQLLFKGKDINWEE